MAEFTNRLYGTPTSLALDKVATSQTPKEVAFDIPVQDSIPSSVLQGNTTYEDVRAYRAQREQIDQNKTDFNQFDNVESTPTIFNDPEKYILSTLYGDREPTQTEKQAKELRSGITDTISGTANDLTRAEQRASEETGVSQINQDLAETNDKIAQRQAQFRRELRAFESNADNRSVSRQFFLDEKNKLEADATAELADLYIIQNAQQGNLDSARSYIKTAVDNRYRAIEIELQQKQAALAELIPTLEAEEKDRAMAQQIALQERERNLATEKEEATAKRELALTAAKNGASSTLVSAITNAESVNDAIAQASPYIGLLERQAAARAASNAALTRRKTLIELAMAGDETALNELGTYGEYLRSIKNDAEALQREQEFNDASEKIDLANRLKENEVGLRMNTGTVQNPILAGLGTAVPTGATVGAAGGSIVPGIGTIVGGVAGTAAGTVVGLRNASQYKMAKEDFQADMKSLVAPEALDELVRRKAAGATFGALSNQELGLLLSASQELAGQIIFKDDGSVSIIGSPTEVQKDLDKVITFYTKAQSGVNQSELDNVEFGQINRLYE